MSCIEGLWICRHQRKVYRVETGGGLKHFLAWSRSLPVVTDAVGGRTALASPRLHYHRKSSIIALLHPPSQQMLELNREYQNWKGNLRILLDPWQISHKVFCQFQKNPLKWPFTWEWICLTPGSVLGCSGSFRPKLPLPHLNCYSKYKIQQNNSNFLLIKGFFWFLSPLILENIFGPLWSAGPIGWRRQGLETRRGIWIGKRPFHGRPPSTMEVRRGSWPLTRATANGAPLLRYQPKCHSSCQVSKMFFNSLTGTRKVIMYQ